MLLMPFKYEVNMKELNDEIIVFPSAVKKAEYVDDVPKTVYGDVTTSIKTENEDIEDLSYSELMQKEDELEEAFDRYGIPLRVERAKKQFEKNKKGKGR